MYLLDSTWDSIRGIFVKIQMWHLGTSNMHALNYCHIVNEMYSLCTISNAGVYIYIYIYLYLFIYIYIYMRASVCVCVCVSVIIIHHTQYETRSQIQTKTKSEYGLG